MFYNQYPYVIFNQNSLETYIRTQKEINDFQQHHIEQQQNIIEMRKAISDFCRAANKVTFDYQQQAMNACLEEIMLQAIQDGYNLDLQ